MKQHKGTFYKGIALCLILAFCVTDLSGSRAEAAGKPKKPVFSVTKRTKTTATIKIAKKDKVTGYRVYLRKGKKGKYRLWTFSFTRTFKVKKLKAGSEYYIKILAYRTKGINIKTSSYSATKKIPKYTMPKAPQITPTPAPEDTSEPEDTSTPAPEDTSEPEATSTPVPEDTSEPGVTSTPVPEDTPAPEATSTPTANYAEEVLTLVNQEREKAGVSPLILDNTLSEAAVVRAGEIVELFDHTRPDGSTCFTVLDEKNISYRAAGENIAAGQVTPAKVMESWMNSEGHRANILSPNFGKLGVGLVKVNSGYQYYWVQLFTN